MMRGEWIHLINQEGKVYDPWNQVQTAENFCVHIQYAKVLGIICIVCAGCGVLCTISLQTHDWSYNRI